MYRLILTLFLLITILGSPLPAQNIVQLTTCDYYLPAGNCPAGVLVDYTANGKAYVYGSTATISLFFDFGDGYNTTASTSISYTTLSCGTFSANASHNYSTAGTYTITAIATGPDGAADTAHSVIMISNSCNNISGQVYIDTDGSCSYSSSTDLLVSNARVELCQGGIPVMTNYTDPSGNYTFSAEPGYNYTLRVYSGMTDYNCAPGDSIAFYLASSYSGDIAIANNQNVSLVSVTDTLNNLCTTPSTAWIAIEGYAQGYTSQDTFDVYVDFGDSSSATYFATPYPLGNNFENFITSYTHTYLYPGDYTLTFIVVAPGGQTDTLIAEREIRTSNSCGTIYGSIFNDLDLDCTLDTGEDNIFGPSISVWQGNNFFSCIVPNQTGHYATAVPAGTYTVSLGSAYGYTPSCPSTGTQTVVVTGAGASSADFAVGCLPGFDVSAYLWGIHFRPGDTTYLYPMLTNMMCNPVSGTVRIVLDSRVHYLGMVYSQAPMPAVNGDTLTWNFNGLSLNLASWQMWAQYFSGIRVVTDISAQIGDTVCFSIMATPTAGDINPVNNSSFFCRGVTNSYDPNSKDVQPEGNGVNHDVAPATNFSYHIEFQNTGSEEAYNILVVDTLDPNLDPGTFQFTGSSHTAQVSITEGNILKFYFLNIHLADSTHNEPQSHGWISYSIAARPNLPNGTRIENRADIFFDYNPAVLTNSTFNTINTALAGVEEQISLVPVIFPNPADEEILITSEQALNGTVIIRDISGREVRTQAINGTSAQLFTGDLTEGVYIISITSNGVTVNRKVMVSH